MAKESIEVALKQFDEQYYKAKIDPNDLDDFCGKLSLYKQKIDSALQKNEFEEHIKNIITDFLKDSFYSDPKFEINTNKKSDSSIMYNNILYALIETKKPSNKNEMITEDNINRKALWEIVYYYLTETRDTSGPKIKINYESELRRLIITDSKKWFLIDTQDLEKLCKGSVENLFYKFKNNQLLYRDVEDFYGALSKKLSQINITKKLRYVYFDLDKMTSKNRDCQYLYKILKRDYLLKEGYKPTVKSQGLNKKFYRELLYLMGFKEEKNGNKTIININSSEKNSLAGQVYSILIDEKECSEDVAKEETFELVLVWINRLLFIKLFEGQLISFNGDYPEYRILDNDKIGNFKELQDLFFNVLGKQERERSTFVNQFDKIPYLNSSLFEITKAEKNIVSIREIQNKPIQRKKDSVLGKKSKDFIPLLEYIIDFLNSYNFTVSNINENEEIVSSEIIDASVLGLIFEKINGYKEGSYYTKSFVTEYICQEVIERTVIDKLNKEFSWHCKSIEDLKVTINTNSIEEIQKVNQVIDNLKICDPAVGSGHFLVSALNRIIALKKELGVLLKYDGTAFSQYNVIIVNDALCVVDGQGKEFKYNPKDALSQSIQKSLFLEKKKIIENCLFGVDINPNAVSICQLRLWIELLKNAYYENGIMETLPNIDINIKTGNSLVSKMDFTVKKKLTFNKKDVGNYASELLKQYKQLVKDYKATSAKNKKTEIKDKINDIKTEFREIFTDISLVPQKNAELKLVSEEDPELYDDSFEWAFEFPEILGEDFTFLGFDCIIGNPPYVQLSNIKDTPKSYKNYLVKKYGTSGGRSNLYIFFIHLGYKLLRKGGILAYIVPNTILTQDYYTDMRKMILEESKLEIIVDYDERPFDAIVENATLILKKSKPLSSDKIKVFKGSTTKTEEYRQISRQNFLTNKNYVFAINSNDLIERLCGQGEPLKGFCNINQGIALKGSATDACKNEFEDGYYKVIKGENISKYGINWAGVYLDYDIEKIHSCKRKDIFECCEKLLFRRTSAKLIFAYDDSQYFALNTLVVVTPKENCSCSLKYLLAILNSKLMNYIYVNKFKSTKKDFSEIQAKSVGELPIIISDNSSTLEELANDAIELRKNDFQRDISDVLATIDSEVYKLYGLSQEEITMVENGEIV